MEPWKKPGNPTCIFSPTRTATSQMNLKLKVSNKTVRIVLMKRCTRRLSHKSVFLGRSYCSLECDELCDNLQPNRQQNSKVLRIWKSGFQGESVEAYVYMLLDRSRG